MRFAGDVSELIGLYNAGASCRELSRRYGLNDHQIVARLLRANGVPVRGRIESCVATAPHRNHRRGHTIPEERLIRMEAARLRSLDENAKGYTVTNTGYFQHTRGKHKGRGMHVVIAEQLILGRRLRKGEHVHHIDKNKQNNDPSNLVVLTASEHMKLHAQERAHNLKANS